MVLKGGPVVVAVDMRSDVETLEWRLLVGPKKLAGGPFVNGLNCFCLGTLRM